MSSDQNDGPFNQSATDAISLLLTRRSGSAKAMGKPGPSGKQVTEILRAAARVPDHGKLVPWRFIVFAGKGRDRFGNILGDVLKAEGERPRHIEQERERFLRAPLVIAVVSNARELIKIPVWEQELSAGAACQNLLIATHALGFVGNWLTEWYAYHPIVKQKMGLIAGERIAGFIYIGTGTEKLEDRPRPALKEIVSYF